MKITIEVDCNDAQMVKFMMMDALAEFNRARPDGYVARRYPEGEYSATFRAMKVDEVQSRREAAEKVRMAVLDAKFELPHRLIKKEQDHDNAPSQKDGRSSQTSHSASASADLCASQAGTCTRTPR